jgi:hypothetical protein
MRFNHSTVAQFRARLRQEYLTATRSRALRIAKYIQGLGLTDTQLKNLFGVNDAQLPALKTRLSNQASLCDSARSAAGE